MQVQYLHISAQYSSCYLSLSLSLSDKSTHTYLSVHSLTNITARTLWPNSPLIDVCLSVKEAQHKEQRWACVWLRGNKEWSIPRQLSDSSGNTAWACLSYGHILSWPTVCSAMNNNMATSMSKSMDRLTSACVGHAQFATFFNVKRRNCDQVDAHIWSWITVT